MTAQTAVPGGITGVLDAASWRDTQGLHMLQPFQEDKIPVVFVHGLMSSPITWLSMFNDLMGNPSRGLVTVAMIDQLLQAYGSD